MSNKSRRLTTRAETTAGRSLGVLRRSGRHLLSQAVRGRIGQHPWHDDWNNFWSVLFQSSRASASCPNCGYSGPFLCHARRPRQICLSCGSRSRHRVLQLALAEWENTHGKLQGDRCLHFAAENPIAAFLRKRFTSYLQVDLAPEGQDLGLDLTTLPFPDGSIDFLLASHVLEHVLDDRRALREIHRVLGESGLAVLSVPITAERTIEFGYADPGRNDHTRECGLDYFKRYEQAGFNVAQFNTDDFTGVQEQALDTWEDGARTVHWISFCSRAAVL